MFDIDMSFWDDPRHRRAPKKLKDDIAWLKADIARFRTRNSRLKSDVALLKWDVELWARSSLIAPTKNQFSDVFEFIKSRNKLAA